MNLWKTYENISFFYQASLAVSSTVRHKSRKFNVALEILNFGGYLLLDPSLLFNFRWKAVFKSSIPMPFERIMVRC